MNIMEYQNKEQSEFNMHLMYLQRCDKILSLATMHKLSREYNDYFETLIALKTEIITSLTIQEKEKFDSEIKELFGIMTAKQKERMQKGSCLYPQPLILRLYKLEEDLREHMKDSGLLIKIKDDASKSLN